MDNDSVIRRLAIFERKIIIRIFGPVYEGDLGWRLRHNKELYELLDGNLLTSKDYTGPVI
jgi:hypothetical protein